MLEGELHFSNYEAYEDAKYAADRHLFPGTAREYVILIFSFRVPTYIYSITLCMIWFDDLRSRVGMRL